MNLPPIEYGKYATLKSLNLMDAPGIGTKFMGVIPGGTRIHVTGWHIDKEEIVWACIGGYPEQWIRAYHNREKNINYVGGDE